MSARSHLHRALASVAAVALVTTACAPGRTPDENRSPTQSAGASRDAAGGQGVAPPGSGPLAFGVKTTLADARAGVQYDLPLPDSELANTTTLSGIWLDEKGQAVALVYDGDQLTVMMWPWQYDDPAALFLQRVQASSAKETVSAVNGCPALVIEPNTDVDGKNPAWIEFVCNGIDVNVESSTYTLDQLMDVASSIA